jgi:tetratricopeptide (TPR) repeat protein
VDSGPWRKRAQQALQASDWKALEQVIEEAVVSRQPPSLLIRLVWKIPYESAICLKLSRRIRQAYPGDFWANYGLANILNYNHSQPEEAIRYYTAALALRPHTPATCNDLGNALRNRGDLDGAIGAYREALDGHSDYVAARENLVQVLATKGDVHGVRAELREWMRFANNAKGYLLLGNALFCNGLRDEAISSYKTAIALDPKLGMAHYKLATALREKKGFLEEAIDSFHNAIACKRRAIELDPADADSYNELAWFLATGALVQHRDPAEAVKLACKAVELAPSNGNNWNTLWVAHCSAGNWKGAVTALEKSMQLRNGGNSFDWFFLAMGYWKMDQQEEARKWYDQAVAWMDKNKPQNEELRRFRAEAAELLGIENKKD